MKKQIPLLVVAFLLTSCGGGQKESVSIASYSSGDSFSTPPISLSNEDSKEISSKESETSLSSSVQGETTSFPSSDSIEDSYALDPMDEPYIGRQFYLNHIGDIYSSWENYRGDGITIAVIDVGFDPYHEDFYYSNGNSKVLDDSASFTLAGSQVNVQTGLEAVKNLGESHGTFCAGVAAAAVNGKGVAGIAPNASLLLLKTDLKPKSIASAFRYAADHGAKVVTISIGSYYDYGGDLVDDGSDLSQVFVEPVQYCLNKGTVVISAGGNGGLSGLPTEYTFPGATSGVIGVGGLAANSSGQLWSGSSYNSSPQYQFCDVFAPAEEMFGCCNYGGKKYDAGWQGTSFASPQVAGMAALYFQKNPSASPADFERDLYASCHTISDYGSIQSSNCGYGRVDVGALLSTDASGSITVKAKANWSSCYCYAWNLDTETELQSWPGKPMSNSGGVFSISLNPSVYPCVIFSSGNGGEQSADLLVSSFQTGKIYDLTSPVYMGSYQVGSYA